MELLTRNPQPPCRCTDGHPERWEHVFTHNLTRMDRRTLHRTLHDILSHPCTSMLLFKIDSQRLAIFPLERDAPRTVDVHAVTCRHPLQAMEIASRHV